MIENYEQAKSMVKKVWQYDLPEDEFKSLPELTWRNYNLQHKNFNKYRK